jgi:hypothetical protein
MAFIFTLSSIAQVPQLPEGGDGSSRAALRRPASCWLALTGAWRVRLTIVSCSQRSRSPALRRQRRSPLSPPDSDHGVSQCPT